MRSFRATVSRLIALRRRARRNWRNLRSALSRRAALRRKQGLVLAYPSERTDSHRRYPYYSTRALRIPTYLRSKRPSRFGSARTYRDFTPRVYTTPRWIPRPWLKTLRPTVHEERNRRAYWSVYGQSRRK